MSRIHTFPASAGRVLGGAMAFGALARAWTEESGEGEGREQPLYERLYETAQALGTWSELVGVLEKAVEAAQAARAAREGRG